MQAAQATEVGAIAHDVPIAVVWPQNQSNIKGTSLNYHQKKKICDERGATSQVSAARLPNHSATQKSPVTNAVSVGQS